MGADGEVAARLRSSRCTTVSGLEFGARVRAGCEHMALHKAELNKINVFPIPDGDTGTNMAMAAKGILKQLRRLEAEERLSRVAAAVAEACVLLSLIHI